MTQISEGLKHYLLILASFLISDLEECGLSCVHRASRLNEHDVNRAFFLARGLRCRMPESPAAVESDGFWLELLKAVTAMRSVLEVYRKDTFNAVAADATEKTAEIARSDIRKLFVEKRAAGQIDFRLHGLSKGKPGEVESDRVDKAIHESFMIKRADRYRALFAFDSASLKPEEQVIMCDAKTLARRIADDGYNDERIDALLALVTVLRKTAGVRLNPKVPDVIKDKFDRMTRRAAMAIGAIVYRDEYEKLKSAVNLR